MKVKSQKKKSQPLLRKLNGTSGKIKKPLLKRRREDEDDLENEELEMEQVIPMTEHKLHETTYTTGNAKKNGILSKHKQELSGLEEADPEFYQYLKENDTSLLDFGNDDDESDVDEEELLDLNINDLDDFVDSDDEGEGLDKIGKKQKIAKKKSKKLIGEISEVTEDQVKALMKKAITNEGSLTSFKKLLLIFRAACVPVNNKSDEEDDEEPVTFAISSPDLYEFIMTNVIEFSYKAFHKFLNISDPTIISSEVLERHPKWKSVQLLILSYTKSVLSTLTSLVDSVNQGQVAVLLISSLEHYIPLLSPLPRLTKSLLKCLLGFWSKDLPPSEDTWNYRGHALLRIRQMVMCLPGAIPEECFRAIYLAYARTCKSFSETTFENVIFMSQSIVELYSCDAALAYQQGFLHIRQLALMVRTAILKKTSDSIRQITNWQFLNCVRLWTRVICTLSSQDELGALAFPLSQVIFGIMSMASTLYYVPLRFHLITCIHQLSAACQIFIPIAVKLLELLENPELTSKSTPSSEAPPNYAYMVKFTSDSIGKTVVRDTIVYQAINLLRHDIEVYRYNVALPEYSYLISKKLRQFSKKCKIAKWRDIVRPLLGQIESFVQFVKENRLNLGKAPAQISEFEALLPKNSPTVKSRLMKLLGNTNINALSAVIQTTTSIASDSKSTESKKTEPESKQPKKKKQKVQTKTVLSSVDLSDEVSPLDWLDE